MDYVVFESKLPSESKRLNLEIVPTDDGDPLSFLSLRKNRMIPASSFERKLGLTFALTNVITDIISISKQIDSSSTVELDYIKGFFKQEIGITIRSSFFTITLEKKFNDGTNTGDIMHYIVNIHILSMYREYSELLEKNIAQKCPRPLTNRAF